MSDTSLECPKCRENFDLLDVRARVGHCNADYLSDFAIANASCRCPHCGILLCIESLYFSWNYETDGIHVTIFEETED